MTKAEFSNYLDEHTEHDLWDELFEDYQNSIEEE